jgi:hypothetical protein
VASVPFPAVKPTGRSYTPGAYPTAEFKSLSGVTTRMLYGNRRSDAELSLEFGNITDTNAALILRNYEQVTPTGDWVSFTSATGSLGAASPLATYLQESGGSGLRWRYAEAPQVSSVFPGRSTVRVTFVGQLDAA